MSTLWCVCGACAGGGGGRGGVRGRRGEGDAADGGTGADQRGGAERLQQGVPSQAQVKPASRRGGRGDGGTA